MAVCTDVWVGLCAGGWVMVVCVFMKLFLSKLIFVVPTTLSWLPAWLYWYFAKIGRVITTFMDQQI